MEKPELIIMLTYNDFTVKNAWDVFEHTRHSKAQFWGMKEEGLPKEELKALFSYMKACGKTTVLEVVAYSEAACMDGARLAKECGCDLLIGTVYHDSICSYCRENHIRYMPFIGELSGRPSVLSGTPEDMVRQAGDYLAKGVYGVNLLGYRYTGDAEALNAELCRRIPAPICLAGSIDSYQKLDAVKQAGPRYFTIGTAFFENKFHGTFETQINRVIDYIESSQEPHYAKELLSV